MFRRVTVLDSLRCGKISPDSNEKEKQKNISKLRFSYTFVDMRILDQDIYLLGRLQQNDLTAFECIFRKYYPILCTYGTRFVPIEDAEEIAGDTLLWLWEHRQALNIQSSLGGYLLKSVYHKAINQIKENEIKNAADIKFFEATQQLMEEENFYRFQELSQRLKEAINALPPSYREAFIMHRFQGKSYKDIADILNVSPKTIDYRIQQALKLLRKDLQEYLPFLCIVIPHFLTQYKHIL